MIRSGSSGCTRSITRSPGCAWPAASCARWPAGAKSGWPGSPTSLLDVIRMASSAIEWYPQVSVGPVVELAVPGYAADDVATLMSALLDNATRYSPGMVTVSCHLLEEGGVMFRIEDTGIGIGPGPGREAERRLRRRGSRGH